MPKNWRQVRLTNTRAVSGLSFDTIQLARSRREGEGEVAGIEGDFTVRYLGGEGRLLDAKADGPSDGFLRKGEAKAAGGGAAVGGIVAESDGEGTAGEGQGETERKHGAAGVSVDIDAPAGGGIGIKDGHSGEVFGGKGGAGGGKGKGYGGFDAGDHEPVRAAGDIGAGQGFVGLDFDRQMGPGAGRGVESN